MAALSWRNVDAPDFRGSLDGLRIANSAFDRAFTGFGEGLGKFREYNQEVADTAVLGNAMKFSDPKAYQEALARGELMAGIDPSMVSMKGLAALDARGTSMLQQAAGIERLDHDRLMNPLVREGQGLQNTNTAQTTRFAAEMQPGRLLELSLGNQRTAQGINFDAQMQPGRLRGQTLDNDRSQLGLNEGNYNFDQRRTSDADVKSAQDWYDNNFVRGTMSAADAPALLNDPSFRSLSQGAQQRAFAMAQQRYPTAYGAPGTGAGAAPGGASGGGATAALSGAAGGATGLGGRTYSSVTSGVESRGDNFAANPNSTARGQGQFLDETWLGVLDRIPGVNSIVPNLSSLSRQEKLDLRSNGRLSLSAIDVLGEDNGKALRAAGLPDNAATRGLAHFLGGGDAPKILRANPNAPVASLLDAKVINANPHLRDMTAGQLVNSYQTKYAGVDLNNTDPAETLRSQLADYGTRVTAATGEIQGRVAQNRNQNGIMGVYAETQDKNDDPAVVAQALIKSHGLDGAAAQNVMQQIVEIQKRTGNRVSANTAGAMIGRNLRPATTLEGLSGWDGTNGQKFMINHESLTQQVDQINNGDLDKAADQNRQLASGGAGLAAAYQTYQTATAQLQQAQQRARVEPALRPRLAEYERQQAEAQRLLDAALGTQDRDRQGPRTRVPYQANRPPSEGNSGGRGGNQGANAGAGAAAALAAVAAQAQGSGGVSLMPAAPAPLAQTTGTPAGAVLTPEQRQRAGIEAARGRRVDLTGPDLSGWSSPARRARIEAQLQRLRAAAGQ